jgi:hypothetical protein
MKNVRMFKIDLLKGEGAPVKKRPEGVIVAAISLIVPVIVAAVIFGFYVSTSVAISIHRQEVANYEAKISELSDAVALQESFERDKNAIGSSMSEVSSTVGRYTQWSPVLVAVVENMPDSMVLTSLEVNQHSIKRKVPKEDDPQTMIDTTIPVKTLRISVSGKPPHTYDRAVRDFSDRLRSSKVLGPKLEDIRVSQDVGKLEGQDVVSYQIDCVFTPAF